MATSASAFLHNMFGSAMAPTPASSAVPRPAQNIIPAPAPVGGQMSPQFAAPVQNRISSPAPVVAPPPASNGVNPPGQFYTNLLGTPAPTATNPAAPAPQTQPGGAPATQLPPGTPQIISNADASAGKAIKGQWVDMGNGVYYDTATGHYRNSDGTITGTSPGAILQYTDPNAYVNGGYANSVLANNAQAAYTAQTGVVPRTTSGGYAWDPKIQALSAPVDPGVLTSPGAPPVANMVPTVDYSGTSPSSAVGFSVAPGTGQIQQGQNAFYYNPAGIGSLGMPPQPDRGFGNPLGSAPMSPLSNPLGNNTSNPLNPASLVNPFGSLASLLGITGLANNSSNNLLGGLGGMFNSSDQVLSFVNLLNQLLSFQAPQQPAQPTNNYATNGPQAQAQQLLYPVFA